MPMAPVNIDSHVGARPDLLYNKGSSDRLFTVQNDNNARNEAFRAHLHVRPGQEATTEAESSKTVLLKCDVALGCGTPESRSYKARLQATESKEGEEHKRDRRRNALGGEQKQERSYGDDDPSLGEAAERATDIEAAIVYRVCKYSSGSRYGYLIDHCPEHQQSVPQDYSQVASHARHTQKHSNDYAGEKTSGVHVNLALGTIALILVFLLLVAIMLVEIVDTVSHARGTSPGVKHRGRSRTRRALARAFGAPRKLLKDNAQKEAIGLGANPER